MPIPRLNLIGLTMFGGPALPGKCEGLSLTDRGLDPGVIMESIGAYPAGVIDVEEVGLTAFLALRFNAFGSSVFQCFCPIPSAHAWPRPPVPLLMTAWTGAAGAGVLTVSVVVCTGWGAMVVGVQDRMQRHPGVRDLLGDVHGVHHGLCVHILDGR